jgi:hypothetical protein
LLRSGTITRRELPILTSKLGLTLSVRELDTVFAALDSSHDGSVTFAEFHPWIRAVRANLREYILRVAVDSTDRYEVSTHVTR